MPVCHRCGEDNPERARFCLACAAPLPASTATARREERKRVSVLFCDLVGFTARSDQADPEDVGALLRPYHVRFQQAADRYVQIGSLPDEAFARLRAAEQLLGAGRDADAKAQLQRALAFYRQVGAAGYLREADALVAASA